MTNNGGGWTLLVSAIAALTGCVGGGASKSSESLVEACSGSYSCESPDDSFDVDLSREGSACDMGGILLRADGSIDVPSDPDFPAEDFEWTGDAGSFAVCATGGGCIACENLAGDDGDGGRHGGECTGSPDSCSSQSPGSCSEVRGCYLHTVYGSDYQAKRYECRGSANSCGGIGSEDACWAQGCDWE